MAEYIEREAYCAYLKSRTAEFLDDYGKGWSNGIISARRIALKFPAADVAPVVHGKWITRNDKGVISMTHPYMCSRCWRVEMNKEPYCNCGAKMDGGDGDAAD